MTERAELNNKAEMLDWVDSVFGKFAMIEIRDRLIFNERVVLELENRAKVRRKNAESGAKGGRKSGETRKTINNNNNINEASASFSLKHTRARSESETDTELERNNNNSSNCRESENGGAKRDLPEGLLFSQGVYKHAKFVLDVNALECRLNGRAGNRQEIENYCEGLVRQWASEADAGRPVPTHPLGAATAAWTHDHQSSKRKPRTG